MSAPPETYSPRWVPKGERHHPTSNSVEGYCVPARSKQWKQRKTPWSPVQDRMTRRREQIPRRTVALALHEMCFCHVCNAAVAAQKLVLARRTICTVGLQAQTQHTRIALLHVLHAVRNKPDMRERMTSR